MDDTLSSRDPRTKDSFHQVGRREYYFLSRALGKERREGLAKEGSLELPRPRQGGLSHPLTAPRSVARPSECIWRSSSVFSSAAGADKPGRGPRGLALPPAPAQPLPATYRPRLAPSRPVSPRRLDSGPPLPRVPTLKSSDLPPSSQERK